jgi:hypothetical protein
LSLTCSRSAAASTNTSSFSGLALILSPQWCHLGVLSFVRRSRFVLH